MSLILEIIHTIVPATPKNFADYVKVYGDAAIPAMERSGFDILGAFKWSTGEIGRDLMVVRFDSMAHMDECSVKLGEEMMKGKLTPLMSQGFELREATRFGSDLPYATEERLQAVLDSKPKKPRQYLYAQMGTSMRKMQAAYETVGQMVEGMTPDTWKFATGYGITTGESGQFVDIWALEGGVGDLSYTAGAPEAPFLDELRDAVPFESLDYINPLPYSRMQ